MIVVDRELRAWAEAGGVTPYDPVCINPASIDLRWSGRYRIARPLPGGWTGVKEADVLKLEPGLLYLLDSMEFIAVPENWAGLLALKSSMGRMGLEHLHAGFFDPGFQGTATLEMEVRAPWNVELAKGQRIIQLAFQRCTDVPDRIYSETGRYQGQTEPTAARLEFFCKSGGSGWNMSGI